LCTSGTETGFDLNQKYSIIKNKTSKFVNLYVVLFSTDEVKIKDVFLYFKKV